VILLLF